MVGDGSEEAKEIGGRADGAAEEGGKGRADDAADVGEKAAEPSKGANHLFHHQKANTTQMRTNISTTTTNTSR